MALCDEPEITPRDLPSDLQQLSMSRLDPQACLSLADREKEYIQEVLAKTGRRKTLAAEILGVPRTTLWRKMKRYGLD